MDVTRRTLPVLSDGRLAGEVVCSGVLENVDPRSGTVCAYMVTPHTPAEVVSNVPDLIVTSLIFFTGWRSRNPVTDTVYLSSCYTHMRVSASQPF
jgi:hypothetical protein